MFDLQITEIAGEPRVLDVALAAALGFPSPPQIRELINRNAIELQSYGGISWRTKNSGARGGRPSREAYLNEAQALLVCMFARTQNASLARKQIIEVFMAWRQGKTVHVAEHHRRPPRTALAPLPARQEFFEAAHEAPDGWATIRASVPSGVAYQMGRLWLDSLI